MILDEIVTKKRMLLNKNAYYVKKNIVKKISLYKALKSEGLTIIGELKKASPSKGIINEKFDYLSILKDYNKSVNAISVLTEEHYFLGKKEYLIQVKKSTDLPVLRKDFIINKEQIQESQILGADAILLIVAILEDELLATLYNYARRLNLDVIVEVHSTKELTRALKIEPRIIGINNRNLKDFTVNLNQTKKLKKMIPKNILTISESGIKSVDDIKQIGPVNGVLIGESFMRSEEKIKFAKELRGAYACEN